MLVIVAMLVMACSTTARTLPPLDRDPFVGVIPESAITSLASQLDWLEANAESGGTYTVEVRANDSIEPRTLSYKNRAHITIRLLGTGAMRTISLLPYVGLFSVNGSMFSVENGFTLILDENITLQGLSENNKALVQINPGGTFVMKGNSRITGNTNSFGTGGVSVNGGTFTMQDSAVVSGNTDRGVYVGNSGIFTMQDSSAVSGNRVYKSNTNAVGGGVYVSDGSFTMQDMASVSDNAVSGYTVSSHGYNGPSGAGGGVFVGNRKSSFTMQDSASVTGNTSNYEGGGVSAWRGSFTILDNASISGNRTGSYGGGVYLGRNVTFTKSGGTIYGNDAPSNLRNIANSGYAINGGIRRDITAGPEDNMTNADFR